LLAKLTAQRAGALAEAGNGAGPFGKRCRKKALIRSAIQLQRPLWKILIASLPQVLQELQIH